MSKIIFETRGPNWQVQGLPYEKTFEYVRPVILDDVPTKEEVIDLVKNTDPSTLVNPWSVYVVKGFRDYIPTTFKRTTSDMAPSQFEELFGLDRNWVPEGDRVLLQLQTEIEAKAATIDAAIITDRMELGTVVNKIHVLNRLYNIGRLYGHLEKRNPPFLFGSLNTKEQWYDALIEVKQQFMDYMLEVPVGPRKYPVRVRQPDVSEEELQKEFGYVNWLRKKLGDNLIGVLLYGSAARTRDPSKYSDFDNWVRVKDVRKAHDVLKGTKPSVLEGKVIEGLSEYNPDAKHLGIHLFPQSDDYLIKHIRFLHDSVEFRKHTLVLQGEFAFPKVSMDEVVERGISQAYTKLKTIAGSLNWAYSAPEKIQGKPSLYEFIVKNIRFFLQHSLNAIDTPRFRDKTELNALLKKRGLVLPEYNSDLNHIKDSLVFSMVSVLELQKELIQYGREPNLEFQVLDESKYVVKDAQWSQLDDDSLRA